MLRLLAAVLLLVGACSRRERAAAPEEGPDKECLKLLETEGIAATPVGPTEGVRTPVRPAGPVGGIKLTPRAGRPPVMDCALLRGLFEASTIFQSLGIDELEYSGAYDYRNRKGTDVLSAHAHGLAIDVHVLGGKAGRMVVARDFEPGVGEWKKLRPGPGKLAACVGDPKTPAGTTLRKLVCRLKLHSSFRIIVTPDDNADHRDHLHLEVYADES